MARTVFLHIGAPKTGTSAIQTALLRNKRWLASNGLIYPDGHESDLPGAPISGNAQRLAAMLGGEGPTSWRERIARRRIRRLLKRFPEHSVVYSSEFFSKSSTVRFASFVEFLRDEGAEVKLIYYVRHLMDHAISSYAQALKGGGATESLSSFILAYKMRFAGVIRKFSHVFERQDIILRLYDRERRDLVRGFFEIILGDRRHDAPVMSDHDVVNRSPPWEELQIMLLVNRRLAAHGPAHVRRMAPGIWRRLLSAAPAGGSSCIVTPEELLALKKNNAKRLHYVNEFAGGDLGLDYMSDRILVGQRIETVGGDLNDLEALVDEMAAANASWLRYRSYHKLFRPFVRRMF